MGRIRGCFSARVHGDCRGRVPSNHTPIPRTTMAVTADMLLEWGKALCVRFILTMRIVVLIRKLTPKEKNL